VLVAVGVEHGSVVLSFVRPSMIKDHAGVCIHRHKGMSARAAILPTFPSMQTNVAVDKTVLVEITAESLDAFLPY
jgi:hypothetical protein